MAAAAALCLAARVAKQFSTLVNFLTDNQSRKLLQFKRSLQPSTLEYQNLYLLGAAQQKDYSSQSFTPTEPYSPAHTLAHPAFTSAAQKYYLFLHLYPHLR